MSFVPGDWLCSSCDDHNFARNAACRKCGVPRSASAPPEPALPPKPGVQEAALKPLKPGSASSKPIYPSVYVSDLPVEYAEEQTIREFCPEGFISVKFLEKKVGHDSCCCIVRYSDDNCAQQAISIIHCKEVTTANGEQKQLTAKPAQPAAWMEEQRNSEALTDGKRNFDERTIWIGRMANSVSSKFDVAQALETQFGEVIHVHLQQDLSHGFVHFASEESAAAALQEESFMLHGQRVEIRKAHEKNPDRRALIGVFEEETAISWEGRFESFKKGHGFLRPIESTASLQLSEPIPPGLETGVYVSKAQTERFGLRDADIVTAIVRQPRQSNNRFLGKFTSGRDEKSWALMRVLKVNGRAAEDHDRGSSDTRLRDDSELAADHANSRKHEENSFEWTGVVELFRAGHHAYLRPLPDSTMDESSDSHKVGAKGVYVSPQIVSRKCLREGQIVRALCDPPFADERSPSVQRVLEILEQESSCHDTADSELVNFEGVFEAFRKGFGFVRPLKGAEDDLDPRLSKGAFVTKEQVDRFDLRDGQRVTALVQPAKSDSSGPGGPKSAHVVDVLSATLEGNIGGDDELWSLVGLGSTTGSSKVVEADIDELPEEQLALKGKKLHGVVVKLKGTHQLEYGFIKADHTDIKKHLFFHPVDIKFPSRARERQFWPSIGESVFFCVATRRVSNKVLLSAARLNFPNAKTTKRHGNEYAEHRGRASARNGADAWCDTYPDDDEAHQDSASSANAAEWSEKTHAYPSEGDLHWEHSAGSSDEDCGFPPQEWLPHPPSGPPPPMQQLSGMTYPHPPSHPPPPPPPPPPPSPVHASQQPWLLPAAPSQGFAPHPPSFPPSGTLPPPRPSRRAPCTPPTAAPAVDTNCFRDDEPDLDAEHGPGDHVSSIYTMEPSSLEVEGGNHLQESADGSGSDREHEERQSGIDSIEHTEQEIDEDTNLQDADYGLEDLGVNDLDNDALDNHEAVQDEDLDLDEEHEHFEKASPRVDEFCSDQALSEGSRPKHHDEVSRTKQQKRVGLLGQEILRPTCKVLPKPPRRSAAPNEAQSKGAAKQGRSAAKPDRGGTPKQEGSKPPWEKLLFSKEPVVHASSPTKSTRKKKNKHDRKKKKRNPAQESRPRNQDRRKNVPSGTKRRDKSPAKEVFRPTKFKRA